MKFPKFYGTRRLSTAVTSFRHLSLSWTRYNQSIPLHLTSLRPILISFSHLLPGLSSGHFHSGFPTKTLYTSLLSLICATCPAHLILLDLITRTILGKEYKSWSSSLCSFLHSPVTSSVLGPNPRNKIIIIIIISSSSSSSMFGAIFAHRSKNASNSQHACLKIRVMPTTFAIRQSRYSQFALSKRAVPDLAHWLTDWLDCM